MKNMRRCLRVTFFFRKNTFLFLEFLTFSDLAKTYLFKNAIKYINLKEKNEHIIDSKREPGFFPANSSSSSSFPLYGFQHKSTFSYRISTEVKRPRWTSFLKENFPAYEAHFRGWAEKGPRNYHMHLIHYENLVKNMTGDFNRIFLLSTVCQIMYVFHK